MAYRPRGMPSRYLHNAPEIVRKHVLDLIKVEPAAPLDYDMLLRPIVGDVEVTGIDFGQYGTQGCHFFLSFAEARAYRERNRRKRVAWVDLPEPTRNRVIAYLMQHKD